MFLLSKYTQSVRKPAKKLKNLKIRRCKVGNQYPKDTQHTDRKVHLGIHLDRWCLTSPHNSYVSDPQLVCTQVHQESPYVILLSLDRLDNKLESEVMHTGPVTESESFIVNGTDYVFRRQFMWAAIQAGWKVDHIPGLEAYHLHLSRSALNVGF